MKSNFLETFVKSEISSILAILLNLLIAFSSLRGLNPFGIFLFAVGITIYGVSNLSMGDVWEIRVKVTKELINHGLFRYVRHPMYVGAIIASFGLAVTLMSISGLLFTVLIVIPFLYYRSRLEEELLSDKMRGYKEYMQHTGMFFPKVKF